MCVQFMLGALMGLYYSGSIGHSHCSDASPILARSTIYFMNNSEKSQFNPEEKSQELLQVQTEVFADRGVRIFSENQAQILRYSSELSKIKDLNNLPADLPEEIVNLVQKNKKVYINFLRQQGKLETSFIEKNIKIYKEKFQPVIEELKAKIAQGNFTNSEYLGSGQNGSVYRIEVDGRSYAVKFLDVTQANYEVGTLLRAKGIPRTSQLEAYSFEDGVTIMQLLPGIEVTKLSHGDPLRYSDQHIIQLIDTVRALDSRGISIDPKASNFMYDPVEGFSVLDYHFYKAGSNKYLYRFVLPIRYMLLERDYALLEQSEEYKTKTQSPDIHREKIKTFLVSMIRFLTILKDNFPDIFADCQREDVNDRVKLRQSGIIDRKNIPTYPGLEPYLKKLEEMGF